MALRRCSCQPSRPTWVIAVPRKYSALATPTALRRATSSAAVAIVIPASQSHSRKIGTRHASICNRVAISGAARGAMRRPCSSWRRTASASPRYHAARARSSATQPCVIGSPDETGSSATSTPAQSSAISSARAARMRSASDSVPSTHAAARARWPARSPGREEVSAARSARSYARRTSPARAWCLAASPSSTIRPPKAACTSARRPGPSWARATSPSSAWRTQTVVPRRSATSASTRAFTPARPSSAISIGRPDAASSSKASRPWRSSRRRRAATAVRKLADVAPLDASSRSRNGLPPLLRTRRSTAPAVRSERKDRELGGVLGPKRIEVDRGEAGETQSVSDRRGGRIRRAEADDDRGASGEQ